jgi:predicted small lipoprotein YifL
MKYLILAILILVSIAGCSSKNTTYETQIKDLTDKVVALQKDVAVLKAAPALTTNMTALQAQITALNTQMATKVDKKDIPAIPQGLSVQDGMEIKSRLSAIEGQNLMFASRQTSWEGKANQQMMQYSNIIEQTRANLSGEFMTKADRLALVNQLYNQWGPRIQALEAKTGLPVGP